MTYAAQSTIERLRIAVRGIVQGVGFRPFVYGQAQRWQLAGFVLNDSSGVTIEIEGPQAALAGFLQALYEEAPPLARIDAIETETIPPRHEPTFVIVHSQAGSVRSALISPDTAICADCLLELFDPNNRRFHYPFINCTNCGPRFTIVEDVPYDRDKTTMRIFPMCAACRAEYEDPLNRRFHAQPNACPVCGPQVRLFDWKDEDAAITAAAQQLAAGTILAIKGLGGYHLACDATNVEAVERLRRRKQREAKPFALMVPDLETARAFCYVNAAEAQLLQSHRRPIVLLRRRSERTVAPAVALAYDTLGIMLPYTPLHYVLLHTYAQKKGANRPAILVMTSGNLSDEPIAYQDDDAHIRLSAIADAMLTHNRDIHMRCDDSVVRIAAGQEQLFRRSRGYAPEPIPLTFNCPVPLLACGGHLKNTFCLAKEQQAFVGHHIGDLENLETLLSFREGIEHFQRLFDIAPSAIAYDLHPEYLATKYALDSTIPHKIGVQHHHAHIASVLAEHGLTGPVIGIAADGTGYGTDGAIWGCELLIADLAGFERSAHLAYVPLPGGEQAVRQPWRIAAAYLAQTYGDAFLELPIPFVRQLDRAKWHTLAQMIARSINSPLSSSLGRLFDAVAALIGLRSEVLYEGQAAIELEILANKHVGTDLSRPVSPFAPRPMDAMNQSLQVLENLYPFSIHNNISTAQLDVQPMMRAIVEDIQRNVPAAQIALRFHHSIASLLATACLRLREQSGLNTVALSGGVFQNRLLLENLMTCLESAKFQVFINRRVPPNDGGLSLGQLAVASVQLRQTL